MLAEAQKAISVDWPHSASDTECLYCECRALISGRLERNSDPVFKDGARERQMRRFTSIAQLQRFASVHALPSAS